MVNGDLARRPSNRAGRPAKAAIRRTSDAAVLAFLPVGSFVGAEAFAGVIGAVRVVGASKKGPAGFHLRGDSCERMGCQSEGSDEGDGGKMHDCGGLRLVNRTQWLPVRR